MSKKYVGITIGPIFDTILDASSPAALWFASYLFSDITKRICEKLTLSDKLGTVEIYSPYFDKNISLVDGVGRFHDRIIFSVTEYNKAILDELIVEVKKETREAFPIELMKMDKVQVENFLQEYLQIHYVAKDDIGEENCILALSPYLDALELMKSFPKDDATNPIRKLFAGEIENKNVWIKESPLYTSITNHQMRTTKDRIISIEEIAAGKTIEPLKHKDYYAVVYADGDNIGKVLKSLYNDADIKVFSKACLDYAELAAAAIHAYGGVTIYAGGDDLLFLAPVMQKEKTILDLCDEIQNKFRGIFTEQYSEADVTVSFGVAVRYKNFPLYEALSAARRLLASAKDNGKNQVAFELQKHSGQSIALYVSNTDYDKIRNILALKVEGENETLHSILYTLDTFASLVKVMNQNALQNRDYEKYEAAWCNLFDNDGQKKALPYIKSICKNYYENYVISEEADSLRSLLYILRLKKFLVEEEGDKG